MASKVGIVESINDGKFFAKDSLGNTKELKNGDIIYENDVVFSDGSNSSNSEIRVALEGEDIIVLKNGVQQLFDSSLIASTFGDEEMVFAKESIDAMLDSHSDITNVWSNLNEEGFSDYQDITEEETAAGEEEEEILEEGSIGQFASRDGDITDIVSDLRKKSWARSQDYREVENSEKIEKISLKSLGGLDSTTNTPPPTVTPPPLTPPTVTPPTVTPPPPVANLSIDDITMYEQDGFMVFTVTLDRPANGNITVNFATSNGSAEAGKDYTPITGIITIPSGSSTAQIRVPIKDDYYYEKSETFNVTLTNPTGNVNIVKPVGVGTILDNPPTTGETPTTNNTPDSGTGTYDSGDTVYVKLVNSATTIEDMTKQTGPIEIDGVKNDGILEHFLQLVDKDGNYVEIPDGKSITVTLEYSNKQGTIDNTDFDNSPIGSLGKVEITLTKDNLVVNHDGTLSYKITNHAIIDSNKEDLESYNLKITDIKQNGDAFENVIIHKDFNKVTGTIIDVTPLVEAIVTPEDTVKDIELTDQTKDISKMLVDNGKGFVELTNGGKVDLYDNGKVVGTITYDENDKNFTFTPNEDYSNYKNADDIKFMYFAEFADKSNEFKQVKVQVTPVADAPTITVNNVTAYEDASIYNQKDKGNLAEGGNKIPLGLKVPLLSKDQTDKNGGAGDTPERNGEITLKFTNGLAVTGAKIFIGNETSVSSTITSNDQEIKVVIVKTSGQEDIDTDYHHKGTLPAKGENVLYLTKTEYESLKIQHAEDNDTDIEITIGVTSYEVDDNGKPLFNDSTYTSSMDSAEKNNLKSEKNADMTVKILPVTDNISIKWDSTSKGTYTADGKTYTFNSVNKAQNNTLNIKEIMSSTSGALNGKDGTKGDLDGSEHRTYEITGLPKGTVVTIGGQTATVGDDGKAKIVFNDANNKNADPDFSIKLPQYYAGTVNGTITLKVQDKGVEESSDNTKLGEIKTDSVNFKINVMPVVISESNPSNQTIQIAQAIGNEDEGRGNNNKHNTTGGAVSSSGNITAPKDGLTLKIEPKGSNMVAKGETATIWIDKVPVGGSLYIFDNSTNKYKLVGVEDGKVYQYTEVGNGWTNKTELVDGKTGNISITKNVDDTYKVEILEYQSASNKLPYFIPPHNNDKDYTFEISGEKVSTAIIEGQPVTVKESYNNGTPLAMSVIVKNMADEPINTELVDSSDKVVNIEGTKYIKATEDTIFKLIDIYKAPPSSFDNDGSEVLSIKITLPAGVTMLNGATYKIFGDEYVIKSTDLKDIQLQFDKNFSGTLGDIKLKYITTEQSGENSSKTHFEQTVKLFVEPKVDGKLQTKSTATEEIGDNYIAGTGDNASKSFYKLDLGVIKNNGDTDEYIDSVEFTVPTSGYELYIVNGTTYTKIDSSNNTIAKENLGKVYVKVSEHFSGDVNVGISKYVIKDKTNNTSDEITKEVTNENIHTLTIKPVTDKPTIKVDTTTATTSDKVTVDSSDNTKITVSRNGAKFTVKVNTESSDKDSSETVQRIEITGVPKGVEVEGAKFEGYKGGSGVWVITPTDKTLDNDGAFTDIKFEVHNGGDFNHRIITIKTFTKDGTASENDNFVNITLNDHRPSGDKGGNGTDVLPDFTLTQLSKDIFEDMGREDGDTNGKLLLGDLFDVNNYTVSNPVDSGYNWAVTFTDIPAGSEVKGLDGRSVYSYEDGGKTYYVVSGTTSTSVTPNDIKNELNKVQIILPKDKNSGQDAPLNSKFDITGNISVTKGGSSYQSAEAKIEDREIKPVTDPMTITITANNIDEDGASTININLSNPNDGSKTELIGNSITIKIDETWKDDATGGVGTKGTLTDPSGKYNIVYNSGDDTYTITPKSGIPAFTVGTPIEGLVYTPAKDRDGDVKFEVSVQNKEGNSIELTSTGSAEIKVTPEIDTNINASTVVATGTEDLKIDGINLANPIKVTITDGVNPLVITDKSETLGNIVLDKIPNGMTVWYKDESGNLKMATNIGTSTGSYTLNPNGDNKDVGVNKWLIPTNGSNVIPEIYVNTPENWAGTFDFDVKLSVYEQNLATPVEKTISNVTGTITAVADGLTASGTKATKKVFHWADLQLNANMKDVDGSEVMNLELTGLSKDAQFKIGTDVLTSAGTGANNIYNKAVWDNENSKWVISGIKVADINKIQFMDTKATTTSVTAKAWTQELDENGNLLTDGVNITKIDVSGNLAEIKAISGTWSFDKDLNLDFTKIDDISVLQNIQTIDLGSTNGKNELLNLTLQDVLDMGKKDTEDKIKLTINGGGDGDNQDKVTFANSNNWTKSESAVDGYYEYTNTSDPSVKVKVQEQIDQIIL